MTDHDADTDDAAAEHEARMVRAVLRDMAIAVPLALIVVFGAIVLLTDKSAGDAAATTVLPGVLMGMFFGGFSGMARTMD